MHNLLKWILKIVLDYLSNDVSPVLIGHFGMEIATQCRCDIVAIILNKHRVLIDQIREKVALANHNHFVTQGDFSSASKMDSSTGFITGNIINPMDIDPAKKGSS